MSTKDQNRLITPKVYKRWGEVYLTTGEFRPPKPQEWFVGAEGTGGAGRPCRERLGSFEDRGPREILRRVHDEA